MPLEELVMLSMVVLLVAVDVVALLPKVMVVAEVEVMRLLLMLPRS
jgi:hypothetical protein